MSDAVYAPPVQRLITELGKLPGIGHRSAQIGEREPTDLVASLIDDGERVGAAAEHMRERAAQMLLSVNAEPAEHR